MDASPTVPRELRAEHAFDLNGLHLGELGVPTLLLVGSESPAWAQRSTRAYASAIPGAQVHTLEGHGHGASVSAPELLATELRTFFEAA
jgi:pimeloyl-ACP methyl ester carboxylesterase